MTPLVEASTPAGWRSSSGTTEDRNIAEDLNKDTGQPVAVAFKATEDRNKEVHRLVGGLVLWRLPFGVTEDATPPPGRR